MAMVMSSARLNAHASSKVNAFALPVSVKTMLMLHRLLYKIRADI